MTRRDARKVADEIAVALMTNGAGDCAERLVLWRDTEGRDLGGLCRDAVIELVANRLKALPVTAVTIRAPVGEREVFSIRDVARICQVGWHTAKRWYDTGELCGYQIPETRCLRVPRTQLIRFMKVNNIPLGELAEGGR